MIPTFDQGIYQHILGEFSLVHAVDSYVAEEWRLACGRLSTIVETFSNVAPVVDIAYALFGIDVSIIVAKSGLPVGVRTVGAIGVAGC